MPFSRRASFLGSAASRSNSAISAGVSTIALAAPSLAGSASRPENEGAGGGLGAEGQRALHLGEGPRLGVSIIPAGAEEGPRSVDTLGRQSAGIQAPFDG